MIITDVTKPKLFENKNLNKYGPEMQKMFQMFDQTVSPSLVEYSKLTNKLLVEHYVITNSILMERNLPADQAQKQPQQQPDQGSGKPSDRLKAWMKANTVARGGLDGKALATWLKSENYANPEQWLKNAGWQGKGARVAKKQELTSLLKLMADHEKNQAGKQAAKSPEVKQGIEKVQQAGQSFVGDLKDNDLKKQAQKASAELEKNPEQKKAFVNDFTNAAKEVVKKSPDSKGAVQSIVNHFKKHKGKYGMVAAGIGLLALNAALGGAPAATAVASKMALGGGVGATMAASKDAWRGFKQSGMKGAGAEIKNNLGKTLSAGLKGALIGGLFGTAMQGIDALGGAEAGDTPQQGTSSSPNTDAMSGPEFDPNADTVASTDRMSGPEFDANPDAHVGPSSISYEIQSGDTISDIAREHGTTVKDIVDANDHLTMDNLRDIGSGGEMNQIEIPQGDATDPYAGMSQQDMDTIRQGGEPVDQFSQGTGDADAAQNNDQGVDSNGDGMPSADELKGGDSGSSAGDMSTREVFKQFKSLGSEAEAIEWGNEQLAQMKEQGASKAEMKDFAHKLQDALEVFRKTTA